MGVACHFFTPHCPRRWDCVKPEIVSPIKKRESEFHLGIAHSLVRNQLHSSEHSENNSQLSPAFSLSAALIGQMKAAGISYRVEIAYRSISKYSC